MTSWCAWLIAAFLVIGGALAAQSACRAAVQAETVAQVLTQELALRDQVELKSKEWLEKITFKWYSGYSDTMRRLAALRQQVDTLREKAWRWTGVFLAMAALGLVIFYFVPAPGLFAGLLALSLIALFIGLITPVFSLVAYKDLPVLGYTILQYESKSLLGALVKLWRQDQHGVAALILVFTVIVPVLKSIVMAVLLAVCRRRERPGLRKLRDTLTHLGKWSMLDVFVVAIVVSWFSLREKGATDAQLQMGLYFFASYVLLSMILAAKAHNLLCQSRPGQGASG